MYIANPAPSDDSIIAQSDHSGRIHGVVAVKADAEVGIKAINLEFREPKGGRWIRAEVSGWNVQRVAFARQSERDETPKERFMREVREDAEREARAKQTIVGAFENLMPRSLRFGVHARYGWNP